MYAYQFNARTGLWEITFSGIVFAALARLIEAQRATAELNAVGY